MIQWVKTFVKVTQPSKCAIEFMCGKVDLTISGRFEISFNTCLLKMLYLYVLLNPRLRLLNNFLHFCLVPFPNTIEFNDPSPFCFGSQRRVDVFVTGNFTIDFFLKTRRDLFA